MKIKHLVLCYVQHFCGEPSLRKEIELQDEPSYKQIENILSKVELYDNVDYEIDHSTGARLPDDHMPKKSKVNAIYAVVEKRFYREVD